MRNMRDGVCGICATGFVTPSLTFCAAPKATKRGGVCNPAAYVLCSPQRQKQGTKRYGRDYKSRPALDGNPADFITTKRDGVCNEARRGLQAKSLRFVQPPKPEARHETLRTGLQIPSGNGIRATILQKNECLSLLAGCTIYYLSPCHGREMTSPNSQAIERRMRGL